MQLTIYKVKSVLLRRRNKSVYTPGAAWNSGHGRGRWSTPFLRKPLDRTPSATIHKLDWIVLGLTRLTSIFFMYRLLLRSVKSRPTVKLWKLWVPSYRAASFRMVWTWSGFTLHERFIARSSSLVFSSFPSQNVWASSGIGAKVVSVNLEEYSAQILCSPEPGLGGISKYVGKKYVYFRLSHTLNGQQISDILKQLIQHKTTNSLALNEFWVLPFRIEIRTNNLQGDRKNSRIPRLVSLGAILRWFEIQCPLLQE